MFIRPIALSTLGLAALGLAAPQRRQACSNPSIRVEYRSLSQAQRDGYHTAVKCLQTKPATSQFGSTLFDDFPGIHVKLNQEIHSVAAFLPWHRYFVHARELALKDCGYTGPTPYWDWTINADNLAASDIWDAKTGWGGNGNASTGANCVTDGPYANLRVNISTPHCLARNFNDGTEEVGLMLGQYHSAAVVEDLYAKQDWLSFWRGLEGGPHGAVHSEIGGDMSPSFSPNDPIFFAHHAQVDRIWTLWQGRNDTRLGMYGGWTNADAQDKLDATLDDDLVFYSIRGLSDVKVKDVMDTLSGPFCYKYDA